ncbi:MAG: molybdopterin-binding protein [Eubacteriales bacterium]
MKQVKTEDAVGHVLCHDITEIIPNMTKGVAFPKGHIVRAEDIPRLLDMGKSNLFVWEQDSTKYHEDEGAEILREICQNQGMEASLPKEGKIDLMALYDGLFVVDIPRLRQINGQGEMMVATRSTLTPVKKGDKLCGTRVIPLLIDKEKMNSVKTLVGKDPILSLFPLKKKKFAIIVTGGEVFHGRIQDQFSPVLIQKMKEFSCELIDVILCDDDHQSITENILTMKTQGAEMILCTGGMSVDPDDKTPLAIKNTGAKVVSYGAPVLPGAMFLLAYLEGGIPVCGLPGCVMYAKRTIFDIVLPLLLADYKVTTDYLAGLGNGGLCLSCENCHFPNCNFGTGI